MTDLVLRLFWELQQIKWPVDEKSGWWFFELTPRPSKNVLLWFMGCPKFSSVSRKHRPLLQIPSFFRLFCEKPIGFPWYTPPFLVAGRHHPLKKARMNHKLQAEWHKWLLCSVSQSTQNYKVHLLWPRLNVQKRETRRSKGTRWFGQASCWGEWSPVASKNGDSAPSRAQFK